MAGIVFFSAKRTVFVRCMKSDLKYVELFRRLARGLAGVPQEQKRKSEAILLSLDLFSLWNLVATDLDFASLC